MFLDRRFAPFRRIQRRARHQDERQAQVVDLVDQIAIVRGQAQAAVKLPVRAHQAVLVGNALAIGADQILQDLHFRL